MRPAPRFRRPERRQRAGFREGRSGKSYTPECVLSNGDPFSLNGEPFPPHLSQQLALARADALAKLGVLLPAVDGFFVALDAVGDLADGQPFGAKSAACSDLADLANEVGIWWAAPSRFRAVPTPLRPQEAFDGQANWASANNCPRLTPIAVRRARQPHLRSSTMAFRPVKRTRVLPPGSLCRRGGQQTGDGQGRRLCRNHPRAKMRATGTRLLV